MTRSIFQEKIETCILYLSCLHFLFSLRRAYVPPLARIHCLPSPQPRRGTQKRGQIYCLTRPVHDSIATRSTTTRYRGILFAQGTFEDLTHSHEVLIPPSLDAMKDLFTLEVKSMRKISMHRGSQYAHTRTHSRTLSTHPISRLPLSGHGIMVYL